MSPKTKKELLLEVENGLKKFETGQELFLDIHSSGKYWDKERFIVWAIHSISKKHYSTLSKKIINRFPISVDEVAYKDRSFKKERKKRSVYTISTGLPSLGKKR